MRSGGTGGAAKDSLPKPTLKLPRLFPLTRREFNTIYISSPGLRVLSKHLKFFNLPRKKIKHSQSKIGEAHDALTLGRKGDAGKIENQKKGEDELDINHAERLEHEKFHIHEDVSGIEGLSLNTEDYLDEETERIKESENYENKALNRPEERAILQPEETVNATAHSFNDENGVPQDVNGVSTSIEVKSSNDKIKSILDITASE